MAGPFPVYTMTLSGVSNKFGILAGEHNGNIFMNDYGPKKSGNYIVQFWWEEYGYRYFTEIIGGTKTLDKITKIVTVKFENEAMTIRKDGDLIRTVDVSFDLARKP